MSRAMRKPKRPDRNRARILAAAQREFAARGIEGASMNAIAARTQTTRAMINYYFGGKESLYLAVLEHVYRGIREAEARLDLEHLTPVEAMRRIVEHTFDYYMNHQDFVNLVVAENQAKGRYLRKSRAMRSFNLSIIDALKRVLARGQQEGRFRGELDAVAVHGAISALGLFNVANQYTFGNIFGRDMGAKGDAAGRRRMVVDIVLRYVQA
jgi:AcrR family transcriptional regulator